MTPNRHPRRWVALLLAVVMAVAAVGTVALGTAALLDLGPFAPAEPHVLEVADGLEDCRDAGRDHGESCAPGADVEAINVWLSDGGALIVELQLTETPDLGPGLAWTAEFYVDTANAHTAGGVICGLSNVSPNPTSDQEPASETVSYAQRPNTIPRELLPAGACDGQLRGSSAQFSIDVTGQAEEAPFRLIGLVRLEYPDDSGRVGSEDDYLVRTSLAELRG